MKRILRRETRLLIGSGLGVVVVAGVLLFLVQSAREQRDANDELRAELERIRKRASVPETGPQLAAPDLPGEPTAFLNLLSRELRATDCRMFSLELLPAGPAGDARGGKPALRAVRTRIGVRGRYPAVCRLVARLDAAERVLAVAELTLRARTGTAAGDPAAPTVEASMVLERYLVAGSPSTPRATERSVTPGLVSGQAVAAAARALERKP